MSDTPGPEPRPVPNDDQIERAMRRVWFPIARSADLAEPMETMLLDEPLVVWRTADGRAVVQSAVCPHRGAALALGTVDGDGIACGYHGWRFRAEDGRCTLVPALGPEVAQQVAFPSRAVLPTFHVEERHGLVWACLESPLLGVPTPPEITKIGFTFDWVEPVTVECGIRAATENFRDVAHFAFVHRGTMGDLDPTVETLDIRRDGLEIWMDRDYVAPGGSAAAYGASFGDQGRIHFGYHAILPTFVFITLDHGPVGHRCVMQVARPISRDRCVVYLGAGIAPDYRGGSVPEVVAMEGAVLAEDVPFLNRLRPREAPLDGAGQANTASDRYTLEYRLAFADLVREAIS